ncbi:hypothetical protein [Pseudomonas gingeri]|uniref:Uncharacterized protein n=1 Tax=Pseudomonas gingeri TaxID=117681 RepID=A0A7Y7YCU7_9PSED|nr:hypothetical protein [Pseudomonas gingeri]NWA02369.1 hypothetical protein [Pseudomonas gingeri]NWA12458.1 hypothetical protein [Pseudomonas gingeri]NWA57136.1 hypothetical protein [Pseudomonas gingeri]NWA93479.1 hypothetical protein [Pseudomonas gingeri]NWB02951.1 hypothetical protein [Pseudomonas gingeri]
MDLNPDTTGEDTCTVQLKLSEEQLKNRGFVYELACRMEGWAGVEILSVERGEYCRDVAGSKDC